MMKMKRWISLALTLLLLCGALPMAAAESNAYYQPGDKMEDFSVTFSDGTETTLYELLSQKKAVLLNFWASWCNPCKMEFPYMEQAYQEMSDEIGIIALSIEPSDTFETIQAVKDELGLSDLPMGLDNGVSSRFQFAGIPTSILIDRNGIVCFMHSGSIPDKDKFLRLFKQYTADDYSESVLLESIPIAMPNVEQPSKDALGAALGIQDAAIDVFFSEDAAVWPFLPSEDGSYAVASNTANKETSATVILSVTAEAGDLLAYEYAAPFTAVYHQLNVIADGTTISSHGGVAEWTADYVKLDEAGQHQVEFTYQHGIMTDEEQGAMLRGIRLVPAAEADVFLQTLPVPPVQPLEGMECEIETVEGTLRTVELLQEGKDEPLELSILQGESVTLRVKLGKDVNAKLAYYTNATGGGMLDALERDEEGYLYHYKLDESTPQNYLYVFADCSSTENDTVIAMLEWCNTEADLNSFLEEYTAYLEQQGETNVSFSWKYADEAQQVNIPSSDESENADSLCQYEISVVDDSGQPVEGAMLQICDDSSCQVAATDSDGKATHTGKVYPYEIHVLMAPHGYAEDSETYTMPEAGGSLTITLKKQ